MRFISKRVLTVSGLALALSLTACGKKDEADDTTDDTTTGTGGTGGTGGGTTDTVTVAGKLSTGVALALAAPTIVDLKLFCVTFEETPRSGTSEFGADGAFSVTLPKNVNFGCFVNNKTTNQTVASFVIASAGGFGGGSGAIALSSSVDLGDLTIGDDGTVSIPASVLEGKAATASTAIDIDALHGVSYTMACQDNGNAEAYAKCQDDLGGGSGFEVFFRILKGTEGGQDVHGLGVWASEAAFTACGGVDMTQEQVTQLASKGIVLSSVTAGTFAANTTACPRRESGETTGETEASRTLADYYALSGIEEHGGGFSFRDSNEHSDSSGKCLRNHTTAIEFTGSNDVMYGAFSTSESRSGDCGIEGEDSEVGAFAVKFTKVN